MEENITLLRTRVPSDRLGRAEKILAKLGIKTSDAVNMLLAQIELRRALPFSVTTTPKTPEELGSLAKAMVDAPTQKESDRLKEELINGFYGA